MCFDIDKKKETYRLSSLIHLLIYNRVNRHLAHLCTCDNCRGYYSSNRRKEKMESMFTWDGRGETSGENVDVTLKINDTAFSANEIAGYDEVN